MLVFLQNHQVVPVLKSKDSASTDIQVNDVIGKVKFSAPDEATGSAANEEHQLRQNLKVILSSTTNATKLSFLTGSGAAATERINIDSS